MKRVFVAEDGRIRSGWVVAAFTAVALVVMGGLQVALTLMGEGQVLRLDDPRLAAITWSSLTAAAAATLLGRFAFKEEVGLASRRAGRQFLSGLGLGMGVLALACGLPALMGVTSLSFSGASASTLAALVVQHLLCVAPTAFAEELFVRGVPLRALSRGINPPVAVVLTSLVFGLLHLTNPGASWQAALSVAVVGVWFAAVAVRTGSLWMSMGLHVGWNFAEGVVFGQPVSGLPSNTSLLVGRWPEEPGFFSGGNFGPEAAGWTLVLLALAVVATLLWPRGTFRAP